MQRATLLLVFSLQASFLPAVELNFHFDAASLNQTPAGFRSSLSGHGAPGDWKIILDEVLSPGSLTPKGAQIERQPVLAQLSRDPTDDRYPLLIFQGEIFGDFKLTTRFKIVDGQTEQMAGIAFRIKDEKNYYYIRASALGKNISFFKWLDGQLVGPIGNKIDIPKGTWQELYIECLGNEIRCRLNGKEAFPALQDNSFLRGRIGFWTKSDSVSYFADTQISFTRKEILAQTMVQEAIGKYPRLLGLQIYAARTNDPTVRLIAGTDAKEIGNPPTEEVPNVLAHDQAYYLKKGGIITVTTGLHDCNGATVAAVRVIMKSFPGQTEKNAVIRATPIINLLESRFQRAFELTQ